MIDAMTCTELPAAIAMEDGQTECTFECNYCRKRTSLAPIRAKPNEPKVGQSFAERKQPSDPFFQTADAPARGRIIEDVNVSESLAERK